mmetsp:Transcript_55923/g.162009  ORF Transcript_55923/g.162009 Transcript_55923/m.162009 type:complete len:117 (-) Transcript_55923:282-632(-)
MHMGTTGQMANRTGTKAQKKAAEQIAQETAAPSMPATDPRQGVEKPSGSDRSMVAAWPPLVQIKTDEKNAVVATLTDSHACLSARPSSHTAASNAQTARWASATPQERSKVAEWPH